MTYGIGFLLCSLPNVTFLQKVTIACNGTIAVFCFMEMVVAIVSSAFCCHGVCRCGGTPTETAVVSNNSLL